MKVYVCRFSGGYGGLIVVAANSEDEAYRKCKKMAYNEKTLSREHRRQWRGSKLIDKSCRNHGTCPWCQRNRNRQKRIEKIRINELLKEY